MNVGNNNNNKDVNSATKEEKKMKRKKVILESSTDDNEELNDSVPFPNVDESPSSSISSWYFVTLAKDLGLIYPANAKPLGILTAAITNTTTINAAAPPI
eukprot:13172003-Ditylum_brightwellii.AAC.1